MAMENQPPPQAAPPDQEQIQLEKMNKMRLLTQSILWRHSLLLLIVFTAGIVTLALYFRWKGKQSPVRYTAELELLYQPKEVAPFRAINDTTMMQLFARNIIAYKTAAMMKEQGLGPLDRSTLEIHKQRNHQHIFGIVAKGSTPELAIAKANIFAQVCINEYRDFRLQDLNRWGEVYQEQKRRYNQQIDELGKRITDLTRHAGISNPYSEQQRLTQIISEQKQTLAQLNVQYARAQNKANKARLLTKTFPAAALDKANKIRDFQKQIEQIDQDILKNSQLYTEKNPKMQVLIAQRKALLKAYREFLVSVKLPEITPETIDTAERLVREAAEAEVELEAVNGNIKVMREAIAQNEAQLKVIVDLVPELSEIRMLLDGVRQNLATTEQTLSDLQYLTISAAKEIRPLEPAQRASQEALLTKKAMVGIVALPAIVTFMLAVGLFILELWLGHIKNFEELNAYYGLLPLGMLPVKDKSYVSQCGRFAFNELYFRLFELKEDAQILFCGRLPGTTVPPALFQTMIGQSLTNGKRLLLLRITPAKTFVETERMEQRHAILLDGSYGYMPVENQFALSSSEMALLNEDLKELKKQFELILIIRDAALSRHGIFFKQMFKVCEASLVLVGARKTRRSNLRYALNLHQQQNTSLPLLTVMFSNEADQANQPQDCPVKAHHHRMNSMRSLWLTAACLCLTGCYNRHTGNFSEYPTLEQSRSAIVNQSGMSEADLAAQLAELKQWEEMPPEDYTINAGDNIAIVVYNHPDLSITTVVTPDGYVGLVFAGQIKLAGKTLKQASDDIANAFKDYIKNPAVGVSPIRINSQTASISGAVKHPGMYNITNDMRLTDLYAQAGGSAARIYDGQVLDAADLKNSLFVREGKIVPLDFFKAIERGEKWHNVKLRKGDYVYIAVRSESMVCLIGEVNNPHKRLWDKNLGLLELLATGGFLKSNYWQYAIIIRGGVVNPTMYRVDLDAVLQGRSPNVMLEPGDVVYVPKDDISEYNVFIRKLMPTPQLINVLLGRTLLAF